MSVVRIDRLELRLSGASRHRAREIATALRRQLGPALVRELRAAEAPRRASRVGRLVLDPVAPVAGTPADRVAREVAARVSRTVAGRLGGVPPGGKGGG